MIIAAGRRQRDCAPRVGQAARRGAMAAAAALACAGAVRAQAPSPGPPDPATAAAAIVDGGNALRRDGGLEPLRSEARLTRAAADFAAHMAGSDRYGHEADGRSPPQRVQAAGYAFCSVAENIAFQYRSTGFDTAALARGFVDGWHASPPHRRNLLSPDATETGAAVARSPRSGRWYGVQLFARPAALQLRFSVVNAAAQAIGYTLDGTRQALPAGATRTHTRCSGGAIVVDLPGRAPWRLQAADGGRYVVGGGPGRWRVEGSP